MIPFLTANWRWIALALLIGAVLYLNARIDAVKAERDLAQQQVVMCQEINKQCDNVVTTMKEGAKTAQAACDKIIAEKTRELSKIAKLCTLEPINEKDRCSLDTDPLYRQYLRMFDKPADR